MRTSSLGEDQADLKKAAAVFLAVAGFRLVGLFRAHERLVCLVIIFEYESTALCLTHFETFGNSLMILPSAVSPVGNYGLVERLTE